jgi:hypothetical protein
VSTREQINVCFLLTAEAFKLIGILVTVFHLLFMVAIHLAGVVNPVRFKEVLEQGGLNIRTSHARVSRQQMTLRVSRTIVILLWLLPTASILSTFAAIPGQGFQSDKCQTYLFLGRIPFRATFSALIVLPTLTIIVLYSYFHILLWKRKDISRTSASRQNIRYCMCVYVTTTTMIPIDQGGAHHPHDHSHVHPRLDPGRRQLHAHLVCVKRVFERVVHR